MIPAQHVRRAAYIHRRFGLLAALATAARGHHARRLPQPLAEQRVRVGGVFAVAHRVQLCGRCPPAPESQPPLRRGGPRRGEMRPTLGHRKWSSGALRQPMVTHGWGNPAGRVDTPASPPITSPSAVHRRFLIEPCIETSSRAHARTVPRGWKGPLCSGGGGGYLPAPLGDELFGEVFDGHRQLATECPKHLARPGAFGGGRTVACTRPTCAARLPQSHIPRITPWIQYNNYNELVQSTHWN